MLRNLFKTLSGKPKKEKEYLELSLDYVEPKDWRDEQEKKELNKKDWKSIRRRVLEKYNLTCQYCGFRCSRWQIVHHINHKKKDNSLTNLNVMCQMCNVIHHSGYGCVVLGCVDLYKKSKYNQNDIVRVTREMREEGKSDREIICFLGLKEKINFKQDRKYLKKLYGYITKKFENPQKGERMIRKEKNLPKRIKFEDFKKTLNKIEERNSEKPSEVDDDYWVYATNKKERFYNEYTKHCGKWMIFVKVGDEMDGIWKEVKNLTEKGNLVDSCKVSTKKENPNALKNEIGVICIYTYNSADKKDLLRVAEKLFQIKGVERLVYKEDKITGEGKYAVKGNKKISKYSVTKENFKGKLSEDLNKFLS